jgi:nicotinamide-nucleotide amidase
MSLRFLLHDGFEHRLPELTSDLTNIFGESLVSCEGKSLVEVIAELLTKRGEMLSTVESCTGGLISATITELPGSSEWFKGGSISYSNELKIKLGVNPETIARHGSVSEECALEMAVSGRLEMDSDHCIAVTGIAGPGGGSSEKPVGTTCIAVATPWGTSVRTFRFAGKRIFIRGFAATNALNMLRLAILRAEGATR